MVGDLYLSYRTVRKCSRDFRGTHQGLLPFCCGALDRTGRGFSKVLPKSHSTAEEGNVYLPRQSFWLAPTVLTYCHHYQLPFLKVVSLDDKPHTAAGRSDGGCQTGHWRMRTCALNIQWSLQCSVKGADCLRAIFVSINLPSPHPSFKTVCFNEDRVAKSVAVWM